MYDAIQSIIKVFINLILHNKNTEGLFSKTLKVSAFGQDDISLLQQSRVQKNITETVAAITIRMFSKKNP